MKQFKLALTDEERANAQTAADLKGVSLTEYIKTALSMKMTVDAEIDADHPPVEAPAADSHEETADQPPVEDLNAAEDLAAEEWTENAVTEALNNPRIENGRQRHLRVASSPEMEDVEDAGLYDATPFERTVYELAQLEQAEDLPRHINKKARQVRVGFGELANLLQSHYGKEESA